MLFEMVEQEIALRVFQHIAKLSITRQFRIRDAPFVLPIIFVLEGL